MWDKQNRIGRTGQGEQDRKDGIAWTGLYSQERTARMGQAERDFHDRTSRT
jgi:hypothetical protein